MIERQRRGNMKCKKCGHEINEGDLFCENCGSKVEKEEKVETRSKTKKGKLNPKIIAIVAVAIIVVLGGGFFVYSNFINDKPKTDNEKTVEKDSDKKESKLKISPEKMEIEVGENQFIECDEKDVTYRSADTKIATVSSSGRVKGISGGQTTITIKSGDKKTTCKVVVTDNRIIVSSLLATSTLVQGNYDYSVNNLIDQNKATTWSEGASDVGIGETVTFNFENKCTVKSINIVNGYCKSEDLYYKNARVKTLTVLFGDSEEQISVEDLYDQNQTIKFASEHVTNQIVLRIDEVYPGNKYSDTCVSEINFN